MNKINITPAFFIGLLLISGCSESDSNAIQYKSAAHITQGLANTSRIKSHLSVYYSERGELPSSNKQAGLPEPEKFKSGALKSIRIMDEGVIQLTFNNESGIDNGILELIPNTSNPATGVDWECTTPNYKGIGELIPQCSYKNKQQ